MPKLKELLTIYDKDGYVLEYWLLDNGDTKLILQHRRLWEKHRGIIPKGYTIHHKNYIRSDNRLGNLMCLSNREHTKRFHSIWVKNGIKLLSSCQCVDMIY